MIQSGQAFWDDQDAGWHLAEGNGKRLSEYYVKFPTEFTTLPTVVVSLNGVTAFNSQNIKIKAAAGNVTQEGFTVIITTWSEAILYGAGVSWLAYVN